MLRVRVLAIALLLPTPVWATPISITYSFAGSLGNQLTEPVDSNPVGGTFSDITRGTGITATAGANSINSSGWTTGATIDANDFYEFTITPDAGYELDVTQIFATFRSSATGPDVIELRSSLNAFGSSLTTVTPLLDSTDNFRLGTLPTPTGLGGALNLTGPVTFRIYAYSAELAAGTFRLGIDASSANAGIENNVRVIGDLSPIAAVPEPASLVLFGSGLIAAGVRRFRQRRPRQ